MTEILKSDAPLKTEVTHRVHKESRDAIVHGLLAFNNRHLPERTDLDVYVRDVDGNVIAGLIGDTSLGWLSIHALWVDDAHRGLGLGTNILKAAEDAAILRGCRAAVLDTLSFQAPAFYEKRGYVRIAAVDGFRNEVRKIFMQKSLA